MVEGMHEITWVDLDHIRAIRKSLTHCVVELEMAFRDGPVRINYWKHETIDALIKAWQSNDGSK